MREGNGLNSGRTPRKTGNNYGTWEGKVSQVYNYLCITVTCTYVRMYVAACTVARVQLAHFMIAGLLHTIACRAITHSSAEMAIAVVPYKSSLSTRTSMIVALLAIPQHLDTSMPATAVPWPFSSVWEGGLSTKSHPYKQQSNKGIVRSIRHP